MRRALLVLFAAACGSHAAPPDAACIGTVYLNRAGGTYVPGGRDDGTMNESILVVGPQTLPPWPHDDASWRDVVTCITTALRPFPIVVTEVDPSPTPHVEIVFTTASWTGPVGTTLLVPASCTPGHQLEFVFGNALPTAARACHVAMQGFAEMTANLSLGDNCADFVNNAMDGTPMRGLLDLSVSCVDAANQPATCRCGGTMENTYQGIATAFPAYP